MCFSVMSVKLLPRPVLSGIYLVEGLFLCDKVFITKACSLLVLHLYELWNGSKDLGVCVGYISGFVCFS